MNIFGALSSLILLAIVPTTYSQGIPTFDENQFVSVYGTIVGSPTLLKALAEREEIVYTLVRQYLEKSSGDDSTRFGNTTFELAQSYVANFEATTGKLKLTLKSEDEPVPYRPNNVAWNCISTYHMIKRFLGNLKDFIRNLDRRNEHDYALQRQILDLIRLLGWPTETDLKDVMSSILRLQHIYDLPTADIAAGIVNGTDIGIPLTSLDCNAIGKQALETKHYALAVEWLELSVSSFQCDISVYEAKAYLQKTLRNDLQYAVDMHDRTYDISAVWDPLFFTTKVQDFPGSRVRRRTVEFQRWKGGRRTTNFNEINYWGVCSGQNYQSEEQKSKLFCWHETKSHPYWKINPLKAELLSYDPLEVVQFYDLIGSNMINRIKSDATFRLARSYIVDETTSRQVFSDIRTSSGTWIDDNNRPEFASVGRKVELITGLRVRKDSASEFMQVAAYSSGSHYRTHIDAFGFKDGENGTVLSAYKGDRVATFLYYLSEVGKGGGTAFPQSGIASVPRRGSAVFWYNLLRQGTVDQFSWHGSCPVILGEKWIANKWMRSNDQMFAPDHSCVDEQDTRFQIKVNGVPLSRLVYLL